MHREAIKESCETAQGRCVCRWRRCCSLGILHGLACRRQLSKLGQWSTTYLNALPEVQDMVNDVDIDGRRSTNVLLSSCLAVVLVALGRQAAWRPGTNRGGVVMMLLALCRESE